MTAEEARELTEVALAKRALHSYLQTIEKSARDGNFNQSFGAIDDRQIEQFRKLGYKAMRRGGSTEVSWSTLPLT